MKTQVEILENVAADIVENTSLLEVIYRINELPPEADNAIACLIRSMQKSLEGVNEYIAMLPPKGFTQNAIVNNSSAGVNQRLTPTVLNSWATEAGNCKMAVCNAMDCIPQELSAIGTLTIVFEKLAELQEVISKKSEKINS
ncbi:MAG: hypothetical protein E6805_21380 [Citrobacter freundii]|uniref:Uncharacterized protein n=1 Tax=Citrobacter freundii TaxID=546 RepID=A0AAD1TV43_CITFR|nr:MULTISPECIES: hypothetical protein [Citrobacter]PZR01899.1 MAG: hypothetical protein DI539_28080 [Flavobacterium psychrophilum]HBA5220025.1 hypothetical protein [Escherichia coli]MDU1354927.1 hypothetical protein [Citrobacter freundii]MDU1698816.1 hypothetical protein [Citrobacter freundii]MDU1732863.1 hypothetical protein [Citrobacter freundii]